MLYWKGRLSLFVLYGLLLVLQFNRVSGGSSSEEDPDEEDPDEEGDGCLDLGTNCQQIKDANLCNNDVYRSVVLEYCRETCELCDDEETGDTNNSPSTSCYDTSTNCFYWNRNGYCNSRFYTQDHKRTSCQKTCGLC